MVELPHAPTYDAFLTSHEHAPSKRQPSSHAPCPMPTLSCQSTCKSTNTGCLFLTLVRRCNPRKMRIKLCLSMPICASKTFGEMVEHMCEQAEAKVNQSSCAVLTLASRGRPCKISCRNPHIRQQTLYDR